MAFNKACSLFVFACHFDAVICMEPLAPLAVQPVWQAGEPIAVNVDYDVPAFGPRDAAVNAQTLSHIEKGFAAEQIHSHSPFTADTTQLSTTENHGSSSFLATKVLPVDADR